jgi:hypothetical protein
MLDRPMPRSRGAGVRAMRRLRRLRFFDDRTTQSPPLVETEDRRSEEGRRHSTSACRRAERQCAIPAFAPAASYRVSSGLSGGLRVALRNELFGARKPWHLALTSTRPSIHHGRSTT